MRTLITALAVAISSSGGQAADPLRILAVFYTGCDEVCEGFQARIAESGLNAEVLVRDINQDKSKLSQIVKEARATPADLVLTYGTSVTLGIIGTLNDSDPNTHLTDIPVVFTLVADPFSTRIADSFERSGRPNVTGTFNRVPETVNIEVIRGYDPAFAKLGLLYNLNEKNSITKKEELEELAPKLGFELVALELDPDNAGPPDPATIPLRIAELRQRGVEWMYMGSSSFLRLHADLYTSAAVDNGIAVVSPYEDMVRENQALLSIAARFYDVGQLAADQAIKILRDGYKPGDLPIVRATNLAYVVNMEVARKLGRFPPFAFLQVAETVGQNPN